MRRRNFIKTITKGLIGIAAFFFFPKKVFSRSSTKEDKTLPVSSHSGRRPLKKGRVVLADYSPYFKSNQPQDKEAILRLLNIGVQRLTGTERPENGWASLFKPSDVVGLKVNTLAGRMLSPQIPVIMAIIDGLKTAGIKEEKIVIWDRTNRELRRAGYSINIKGEGVRCFGSDVAYYEDEPEVIGSVGSCFSTILSRLCTAIINIGVLKDHDLAGVSIGMKNFYGAIHNPNKYHDNNCDPYVADLNSHPYIKNKVRLIICDGIRGQYNGGPAYKPQWAWNANVLLISRDPVALDRVGYELIEKKRKEKKLPSLKEVNREPKWIKTASKLGLGEGDISKIAVIKI